MPMSEAAQEIDLLNPDNVQIYLSEKQRVCVDFLKQNTTLHNVNMSLMFPLTMKRRFLRLYDQDKKEIGIISDIDQLDAASIKTVEHELNRVYFLPQITKINHIEERFGTRTWDVETEKGQHTFDVRGRENVRYVSQGHLVVKDVDGNRYEVVNVQTLDYQSKQMLEVAS